MNKKLDQMKQEYLGQEVPDGLKDAVMRSMKKAKKENRFRKYSRWASGMAAAAASLVLVVNVNPNIAYAMEAVPVLGSITKAITFRTFEKNDGAMQIQMEVPHVNELGNQQTEDEVNRQIDAYTQQIEQAYEAEVAAATGWEPGSYDTSYQVITNNEHYFSLRIDTTLTKGSAAEFSKFFTIDKADGKLLALDDLFEGQVDYCSQISADILAQMKQQMETDASMVYYVDQEEDADAFTQITPNQNFYISADGQLVVVFDEYEVAPGYMGTPELVISVDIFNAKSK